MPIRPSARLLPPSAALGACVFAGVERDTRGASLTDAERFNYYPATPMALISWVFAGSLHMVEERGPVTAPTLGPPLPRLVLSGPQRLPSASWSPGTVHALSVAFYPEALSRLLGCGIEPFVDRILPLETVAPEAVMAACETLFLPSEASEPFQRLEQQLAPLWHGPHSPSAAPIMGDWIRALATRAAHSEAGRSLRQMQRRIKDWTGQSQRDLKLLSRVEEAFVRTKAHRREGALDLAGLACEAGFADQSHMGREVRRVTGLSPARFDELVAQDEAFWFYRLIEGRLGGR